MNKKILGWAVVIFIAYWLATNPTGAAQTAQGATGLLTSTLRAVGGFLRSL